MDYPTSKLLLLSYFYQAVFLLSLEYNLFFGNHSIFRHDNFIGCFSADKIKMSARK